MVGALVTSSHSQDSLCGSGLDRILLGVIAEFNNNIKFIDASGFSINGLPEFFKQIKVTPLSPADSPWHNTDDHLGVQNGEVLLTNFSWTGNSARKDGKFSVWYKGRWIQAAVELKCYPDKAAPTETLTQTIRNTKDSEVGVGITIMVVTKGVKDIRTPTFADASKGCHVVRIRGDACDTKKVGTTLTCEVLSKGVRDPFPVSPLVIQVDLESIYYGRNEEMENAYYEN